MNEREKLIKEIEDLMLGKETEHIPMACPYTPKWIEFGARILDFILADRKRILGEVKECLENKIFTLREGSTFATCEYQLTIDKALEIIKKYEGDV